MLLDFSVWATHISSLPCLGSMGETRSLRPTPCLGLWSAPKRPFSKIHCMFTT